MLTTLNITMCAILLVMVVYIRTGRYEWKRTNKDSYPITKELKRKFYPLIKD